MRHKDQNWSAETYARNGRFVSDLGVSVLAWLDARPGERILDLGCGDGVLTQKIAQSGACVVGIDASEQLIASARGRGLDVRLGRGEALGFDREFDAVFSNAALHWMTEPRAVINGVHRALKPDGRFVAEFGGHGNVAAIVTALIALADRYGIDDRLTRPWFFPTAEEYAAMLKDGGFDVERIELIPRPTRLPGGLGAWLETFREPFLRAAGSRKERIIGELEALLSPSLRDQDGTWTADYVRLRFIARRS